MLKKTLLFALLAAFGPACLSADTITLTLDSVQESGSEGSVLTFSGRIQNNTSSDIYLQDLSLNLNSSMLALDNTAFFNNTPSGFLTAQGTAGSNTGDIALFTVTIHKPFSGTLGVENGTVTLLGGGLPSDLNLLTTVAFSVDVVRTPEPSSALLVLCAILPLLAFATYRVRGKKKSATLACLFSLLVLLFAGKAARAQSLPAAPKDDQPVATVAGQSISARELDEAVAPQVTALHNQEFQIKSKALDNLLRQKTLEAEAHRRGLTVDQLYAAEVDSKFAAPSEAEVHAYYVGVKSQLNGKSFDEVKKQLAINLRNLEVQQARQEFVETLAAHTEATVFLQQPRFNIVSDPQSFRGDRRAPVTVVEFADFQCPYCKQTEATLEGILKKHGGEVKISFRDFPLTSIHPYAQKASEAAHCAGKQGKYWEYHDALFASQPKLDIPDLNAIAHNLSLDEAAFQTCVSSGETRALIAHNVEDARKLGINSTPSFFINGLSFSGAMSPAEFDKVIDSELKRVKPVTSTTADLR